jgi:hypothetical protein
MSIWIESLWTSDKDIEVIIPADFMKSIDDIPYAKSQDVFSPSSVKLYMLINLIRLGIFGKAWVETSSPSRAIRKCQINIRGPGNNATICLPDLPSSYCRTWLGHAGIWLHIPSCWRDEEAESSRQTMQFSQGRDRKGHIFLSRRTDASIGLAQTSR